MAVRLYNVDAMIANHGVKVLVYSAAKIGKTKLITTCPRPVVFSAEEGLLSVRGAGLQGMRVKTMQDLEDVVSWAQRSNEARAFDTICLDSITEISQLVLVDELKRHKHGQAAYGELGQKISGKFRQFRDLQQKHVYFIAQEQVKEVNGIGVAMPSMPGGALTGQAPYFFDEVFRLELLTHPTEGFRQRFLRTQSDGLTIVAGDRSGKLDMWEPANLSHVFNKIMAG